MKTPAPTRHIPLNGAVNFRDIGGYPTADGRTVKWRQLFRSDSLAELSEADLDVISALGLRTLCDLRHDEERAAKPNRLAVGSLLQQRALGFYPQGAESLMERLKSRRITVDEATELFMAMYRQLPVAHIGHYAQLMQTLLPADALPALIHCTSGKDRTGFAITALLLVLGVPREVILEDYVLTNQYRRDLSFMVGSDVDASVLAAVKSADPKFLQQAFESIDAVWGSTEGFIRQGLKLGLDQQKTLQLALLE